MPEGVPAKDPIEVRWEGGMRWRGGPEGGPTLLMDGEKQAAPSPVDALVASTPDAVAAGLTARLGKVLDLGKFNGSWNLSDRD